MKRVDRKLKNKQRMKKKIRGTSVALSVPILIGGIFISVNQIDKSNNDDKYDAYNEVEAESEVKGYTSEQIVSEYIPGENPLYIDGIIVANKEYQLPEDHLPGEAEEAREAFEEMKQAASLDGISIYSASTYRSYEYQVGLFDKYIRRDGEEAANKYSAKPGHSEHQTGLAFDIGGADKSAWINSKFDDTKEAKWLYENAYKYGFILRYPEDKTHITGYVPESWHYRYIGTEHSYNFAENDLTLEEYLGLYPDNQD